LKKISFLAIGLLLVTALLCGGLSACGSDEGKETEAKVTVEEEKEEEKEMVEEEEEEEEEEKEEQRSGGDFTWDDMPVYPHADQVTELSMMFPPTGGEDYTEMEQHYYETSKDLDDVVDWYKSEMPKEGWEEVGRFGTPEMTWVMYNKNNENDFAATMFAVDESGTVMVLMRASR
jgi:hypothetical protein